MIKLVFKEGHFLMAKMKLKFLTDKVGLLSLSFLFISLFFLFEILFFDSIQNENSRKKIVEIEKEELCPKLDGKQEEYEYCLKMMKKIKINEKFQLKFLLQNYIQLHKKIMDPLEQSVPKRYVVLDEEPEQGLGNRFQVIVSTFLFALLTNRAFLVNWPKLEPKKHWNNEEIVGMPSLSELLQNPSFEWDFSKFAHLDIFQCQNRTDYEFPFGKGKNTWFQCCNGKEFAEENGWESNEEGCFNITRMRGIEPAFQCSNFDQHFTSSVIYFKTWDYFVPHILLNPFYRAEMMLIFEENGTDVFHPLSNFLLRPIPSIQTRIDSFKKLYFGNYTLGLQIRRVGINKLNSTQEDLFIHCAAQVEESMEFLPSFKVRWFLATDNYKTRKRLKSMFGEKLIFQEAVIARNDTESVIAGLIDMWLLSECEDIMVSAASTYGKIAFGLKGKPPRFVNKNSVCREKLDWQPCFFQYQPFFCLKESSIPPLIKYQIIDCDLT